MAVGDPAMRVEDGVGVFVTVGVPDGILVAVGRDVPVAAGVFVAVGGDVGVAVSRGVAVGLVFTVGDEGPGVVVAIGPGV